MDDEPDMFQSNVSLSAKVTDSSAVTHEQNDEVQNFLIKFKEELESYNQCFAEVLEMNEAFKLHYCMKFYMWFFKREANIVKLKDLEKMIDSSKAQKEKSAGNIQKGTSYVLEASNSGELDFRTTLSEYQRQKINEIIEDEEKNWNDLIRGHEKSLKRCGIVYYKLQCLVSSSTDTSKFILKIFECNLYKEDVLLHIRNLLCRFKLPLSFDIEEIQNEISALIKEIVQKKTNNVLKDFILDICHEILNTFEELLPKLETIQCFAKIYKYRDKSSSSFLSSLKMLLTKPSLAKIEDIIFDSEFEKITLRDVRKKLSSNEDIERMMMNYSILDSRLSALESKSHDQDISREDIKILTEDVQILKEDNRKLMEDIKILQVKYGEMQIENFHIDEYEYIPDAYRMALVW